MVHLFRYPISTSQDELVLLLQPRLFAHPHVVNLIGYRQGGNFGVIDDLLDTLYTLVRKGKYIFYLLPMNVFLCHNVVNNPTMP